jgi:hypothetical protein
MERLVPRRQVVTAALAALLAAGCGGSAGDPAPSPSIPTFLAIPASVDLGSSSTLAWRVTDATSLTIDQSIGAVTGGSKVVVPGSTVTYTLTATGPGGSVSRTTTLTVTPPATVLEVACSGSSCGAASPHLYSGAGIGIWRFHNATGEPRTIDIHVGGVSAGDQAALVFSNGTATAVTPLPSAGAPPSSFPTALRVDLPGNADPFEQARGEWRRGLLEANRALGLSLRSAAAARGTRASSAALAAPATPARVVGDRRAWYEAVSSRFFDTVALAVCDLPGASGRRAVFWVDPVATTSGEFTAEDLAYFQATFCGPVGAPMDGGFGRVTALVGDVWGPLDPAFASFAISDFPTPQDVNVIFLKAPAGGYWAGYFWGGNNLLPSYDPVNLAGSNEALAFFIDTNNVHAHALSQAFIASALLHELTHMATFYQRSVLRGTPGEVWQDETTCMMVEDIVTPAATPDHVESTLGLQIDLYARSGGAVSYMDWLPVTQDSYALAGSFAAFVDRRYGTSILSGMIDCQDPGIGCLDDLIAAGGGVSFADEFERLGASIFGLLPLVGTPEGYGYPRMESGAYTLEAIDIAAYGAERKPTATPLGDLFAPGTHTYQLDTVAPGRGVYSRTGVVVPGHTSILLVIQ